jgi:hypothetical protein
MKRYSGVHTPAASKGYHWRMTKVRRDAGRKGGSTAAQKLFARAADACPYPTKGTAKQRRSKYNECIGKFIKAHLAEPGATKRAAKAVRGKRVVVDTSICDQFQAARKKACLENLRKGRVLFPR